MTAQLMHLILGTQMTTPMHRSGCVEEASTHGLLRTGRLSLPFSSSRLEAMLQFMMEKEQQKACGALLAQRGGALQKRLKLFFAIDSNQQYQSIIFNNDMH